ncbi:MAG: ATP-dependent DNA helicase RecQ [Arenicella sp.]|jgi:ATP-dependent DNA helicase RecQ
MGSLIDFLITFTFNIRRPSFLKIALNNSKEILSKYWNHDTFRPNQEEIIEKIISGEDILALLPTGGGKSICYQIPALMSEGICIVISPLIALMEDQVSQLKAKGIKAIAINSGMRPRQIDILLDNCVYGDFKFLYVSPERIKTRLFLSRLEKMNVSFIAVDEAHCISEWGFDFRPSYRDIAKLREVKKDITIAAFTATATPDVVLDIQDQLEFKTPLLIQSSFKRSNLSYNVMECDNKLNRIHEYILAQSNSGIIYCNTRKEVKFVCQFLVNQGINADFYHGGLEHENRKKKQQAWMNSNSSVIVCTNAFGMGIDKPNVRFVLHYSIPQSLEAYFQEAGRAGRDGKNAEAFLFYEKVDIQKLKDQVNLKFTEIAFIKRVYNAMGNFFQLAIGSGKEEQFAIDMLEFCDRYNFELISTFNALKFLEMSGFIVLSENFQIPSKLKILADRTALYNYQVKSKDTNKIVQFIVRTQMGVFDNLVIVNEKKMAKELSLSLKVINERLKFLSDQEIIEYYPSVKGTHITYVTERLADNNLSIPAELYHKRKNVAHLKLDAVIDFLKSGNCTTQKLLKYFGEEEVKACQKCSNCLESEKAKNTDLKGLIRDYLKGYFKSNDSIEIVELIGQFPDENREQILETLRWMIDHNEVHPDPLGKALKRP